MKKKNVLAGILSTTLAVAALTGCGGNSQSTAVTTAETAAAAEVTAAQEVSTQAQTLASAAEDTEAGEETALPTKDLSGNDITVPESVTKIISMAPSITRLLIDLGLSDEIIAVDTNSEDYYGDELPANLPTPLCAQRASARRTSPAHPLCRRLRTASPSWVPAPARRSGQRRSTAI